MNGTTLKTRLLAMAAGCGLAALHGCGGAPSEPPEAAPTSATSSGGTAEGEGGCGEGCCGEGCCGEGKCRAENKGEPPAEAAPQ